MWDRASFKGSELAGKTIGIVGLGLIGREVAAICQKFEMRTVAYDPVMSPDVAARSGIQLMPLKSLFLEADFLTVHTPLNEATKDLIDAHALNSCKTGVKVINTARGGIINEQALLDALKSGQVSGAALDVFTTEPPTNPAALELIDHPNVICTPHLGEGFAAVVCVSVCLCACACVYACVCTSWSSPAKACRVLQAPQQRTPSSASPRTSLNTLPTPLTASSTLAS